MPTNDANPKYRITDVGDWAAVVTCHNVYTMLISCEY